MKWNNTSEIMNHFTTEMNYTDSEGKSLLHQPWVYLFAASAFLNNLKYNCTVGLAGNWWFLN
jgi:hypothetical protein